MSALEGKVALVTGAAHGIGAAVATTLAARGAQIVALDRDEDGLGSLVTQIEAAGGRALARAGDVASDADVAAAVRAAVETLGGLDLLASIAGVIRYAPVPELDEATWDLVMDTNVKGAYLCAKHAIPAMRERGGGAIVNAASVLAFASQPTVAAYTASKAAVVALTRTLALDHAEHGIRVNCIAPGSVRTPMLRYAGELFGAEDPEGTMESWGQLHPIGRLIEPAEVAEVVAFLLGEQASAVTGSCYVVDGGLSSRL